MSSALPLLIALGVAVGWALGVKTYDAFAEGVSDGFRTVIKIAPNLCAAVICLSLMRQCGLMQALAELCAPVLTLLGVPSEVAPLLLMRPLSGSASLGIVSEIFASYGPDSYVARVAATMMGSTETVLYTLAIYCSAAKVKGAGWVVAISLLTGLAGAIGAALICKVL